MASDPVEVEQADGLRAATALAGRGAGPLAESIAIMARLRDRVDVRGTANRLSDTIQAPHAGRRTYEVSRRDERRAWPDLKDEAGRSAAAGAVLCADGQRRRATFDIADVAANLNAKLVGGIRYLSVDGKLADATDANAVATQLGADQAGGEVGGCWGRVRVRLREVRAGRYSAHDAGDVGGGEDRLAGAKVGFDWPSAEGIFEKLQEEIAELKAELTAVDARAQERVSEEFGDLPVHSRESGASLEGDAESALAGANAKFRGRFRAMEAMAGGFDALVRWGRKSWIVMNRAKPRMSNE